MQLRYTPPGPGESVWYQRQERTALRSYAVGIDTVRPEHAEVVDFGIRLTSWEPPGRAGERRATFTVFAEEVRSGTFLDDIREFVPPGRGFEVSIRDGVASVVPKRPTADSALTRVRQMWSATPLNETLGAFIASQRFVAGATQPVPAPLLQAIGLSSGSIGFERVETRWQRRVLRFRLEGRSRQGQHIDGDIHGMLLVDSLSGHPLQLSTWGRIWNGDSLRTKQFTIGQRGVRHSQRVWAYSSVPLQGHLIGVIPQGAPQGNVRALTVSPDGRTLAMFTSEGQVAFWDAEIHRITSVRSADAIAMQFAGRFLIALDGSGFARAWLASAVDGVEFGRSVRGVGMDDPAPIGFAVSGLYPVVGHADGTISVRNLGHDRIVGRERVSPLPVQAIAGSPNGRRFAVIDSTGGFRSFGLSINSDGCTGDPSDSFCELASLGKISLDPVDSLGLRDVSAVSWHPRDETVAIATRRGDVVVRLANGTKRRYAGAGRRVAFSPDGRTLRTEIGEVMLTDGRLRPFDASERMRSTADDALSIAQSPDGTILYRSSRIGDDALIELVDVTTGMVIETIVARTQSVAQAVADTSASQVRALVADNERRQAWDLRELKLLPVADAEIAAASFRPSADTERRLREVLRNRRRQTLPRGRQAVVVASDDGRIIAATHLQSVSGGWNRSIPVTMLIDAASGRTVHELPPRWGRVTAGAFSADERRLAVGDENGLVIVYDIESGVVEREIRAHTAEVTAVSFVPGTSRLLSGSTDGTLRLWELADGGELLLPQQAAVRAVTTRLRRATEGIATFVAVDGSEHVVVTADGYYTASTGALRGIALVDDDEAFDFERYDRWLNRPDVVAERLGVADAEWQRLLTAATARRLASFTTGAELAALAAKAPGLELTYAGPRVTTEASIAINLRVTSIDAAVRRLDIRVNGVPLDGLDGRPIATPSWEGALPIPLGRGTNRIQVVATDAQGIESPVRTLVVSRTAPPRKPTLFILAVGVSTYRDANLSLAYAAKDAGDLVAALRGRSDRYEAVRVRTILDTAATRERILASREFLAQAGVDDELIVFFAGHGFLDARLDYYFGTSDVSATAPERRGLGYRELLGLFDGLRVRKRLLLLDTCHAGEVDREAGTSQSVAATDSSARRVREFRGVVSRGVLPSRPNGSFALMRDLFADLGAQSGATVLSAAGGAEFAMESARWNNGVFTFSVLEGLDERRADADGDAQVTVTELERYVARRVVELTRGGQRPNARQRNLDLDFVVR